MLTSPASQEEIGSDRILRVEKISAGYADRPVIVGIDLEVSSGEIVSVLGPNGAGKSTLLKAIVGVVRISVGSVLFRNKNVTNMAVEDLVRLGVGYVPQHRDVFDDLTVHENLEMGGYLLRASDVTEREAEILDLFPVLKDKLKRQAAKLSGGERKMVGVGRALMAGPSLVVLDEPTAGLAPDLASKLLQDDIQNLASTGVGVLLVEQRASAALEISHRAYVLVSGKTVLKGPPAELLARDDFGQLFLGQSVDLSVIPSAALE
jgi:branched-chain amino acid transport system ATP-binding protein